ncbi:MAG: class I tRNA ligase family protein, partial [Rickettsiales bacterium]|nr:class I tRNA ligase family protein [Rickettsiales bacterium]
MQENWIGKSEGALVKFVICPPNKGGADEVSGGLSYLKQNKDFANEKLNSPLAKADTSLTKGGIEVYTTRPDTLFGASFVGLSADHSVALELAKNNKEIANFIEECKRTTVDEKTIETMEKKGIFTGLYVEHPFDKNWKLPVWIANFILMDYGTGAIFACPAHDTRDFEFATKYNLPIKQVVARAD